MNLATLAWRNVGRNKIRVGLTVAAIAVVVILLLFLRTVIWAFNVGAEQGATDRLVTRHKVSIIQTLPIRYVEDVRAIPGVAAVAYFSWFGARDPKDESGFFASLATDPETLFPVYSDIGIDPAQRQAWIENKRGAMVGKVLAKQKGWTVGQKVILEGTIYPGKWEFEVSGIYEAKTKAVDNATFFFHWDYLNDSLPPSMSNEKDRVGWILSRVTDPTRSAEIARAVDKVFDERDDQTLSESERAFNLSFLGGISAILFGIDLISLVLLGLMGLILGNTIAMGVRERTFENGVLRAVGFRASHVVGLILGEAAFVGLLGGLVGTGVGYLLVDRGFGRWVEENLGQMIPYFQVQGETILLAFVLAIASGVLSALLPALLATRVPVVTALRKVE